MSQVYSNDANLSLSRTPTLAPSWETLGEDLKHCFPKVLSPSNPPSYYSHCGNRTTGLENPTLTPAIQLWMAAQARPVLLLSHCKHEVFWLFGVDLNKSPLGAVLPGMAETCSQAAWWYTRAYMLRKSVAQWM